MKRFFIMLLIVFLACCLCACGSETAYVNTDYDEGFSVGYDEGCVDGFDTGYMIGVQETQDKIASYLEDDLWDICDNIEDKYGMRPEDAVQILANYADDPDAISEQELNKAIWVIFRYYHDSHEIIYGVDDYWID